MCPLQPMQEINSHNSSSPVVAVAHKRCISVHNTLLDILPTNPMKKLLKVKISLSGPSNFIAKI